VAVAATLIIVAPTSLRSVLDGNDDEDGGDDDRAGGLM
jgi:hypothetical protein